MTRFVLARMDIGDDNELRVLSGAGGATPIIEVSDFQSSTTICLDRAEAGDLRDALTCYLNGQGL